MKKKQDKQLKQEKNQGNQGNKLFAKKEILQYYYNIYKIRKSKKRVTVHPNNCQQEISKKKLKEAESQQKRYKGDKRC